MEEDKKILKEMLHEIYVDMGNAKKHRDNVYFRLLERYNSIDNILNKLEELEKENAMLKNTQNNCPYINTSGVKCQVKKLEAKNKRYERYLKNKDTEHEKVLRFIYDERDKDYIPKSKIQEILKQRLNKYREADDGIYKQDYLTRGELELVDRYKECSELYKLLYEKDVYKLQLDYIPKSKIEDKIKELERERKISKRQHIDLIKVYTPLDIVQAEILRLKELLEE